jgi:hypothetical protein
MWEQRNNLMWEKEKEKLKHRQIWEQQSERVGKDNGFFLNEEEQS